MSRSKGLRHLKTQGSNKIHAFCPAGMSVIKLDNEKLQIKFIKSHIGHEINIGHLILTTAERKEIAVRIASKIPFSTILGSVCESVSESNRILQTLSNIIENGIFDAILTAISLPSAVVRIK